MAEVDAGSRTVEVAVVVVEEELPMEVAELRNRVVSVEVVVEAEVVVAVEVAEAVAAEASD